MKKIILLIAFFSVTITQVNAQKTALKKKVISKKIVPKSIYTVSLFENDANGFSAVNKKLNLSTFKFLFSFKTPVFEDGYYNLTVASENSGKKTRSFLTNDTKYYFNSFIRKNDPTKWPTRYFEHK